MLFWGPAIEFISALKPNGAKNEIRVIDDEPTADHLLNWINQQIRSSYGLDDEKDQIPSDISDPERAIETERNGVFDD
ncbi:hypothetical protein V6N13_075079 [Hibiscus sabdariffa]|uniref:Uncharacterized protein n=1 Tax=Hibiscus sabdariffa TaxID=183260 RepID=A0ABR2UAQ0_9ROSI